MVFCGLLAAGIVIIVRSESIYKDSLNLTTRALNANGNKQANGILPNYTIVKDSYSQALSFFTLAIGCIIVMFLLPRLQNLSIGPSGINVSLQSLQANMNSLLQQNNGLQANSAGSGGIVPAKLTYKIKPLKVSLQLEENLEHTITPPLATIAEVPEKNSRAISATVQNSDVEGFFQVAITVKSTDPNNDPLTGTVKFHLHPNFQNPNPVIAVQDKTAVLQLKKVQGPFIVSAITDDGKTTLTLNLGKETAGVPPEFYGKSVEK